VLLYYIVFTKDTIVEITDTFDLISQQLNVNSTLDSEVFIGSTELNNSGAACLSLGEYQFLFIDYPHVYCIK